VFQINEIGEGHALKYVGLELLQKYDLVNKYKVYDKHHILCIGVTFYVTIGRFKILQCVHEKTAPLSIMV